MSGGWWRDPFLMRRAARWSLLPLTIVGALCAVGGGFLAGLLVTAIIVLLPVAAFYEARGSLFVLQYTSSSATMYGGAAPASRRPRWLPWLGIMVGGVAVIVVFAWIAGRLPRPWAEMLTAAALVCGIGLFLGGLFTLGAYYLDREIASWFDREAEADMKLFAENERKRTRNKRTD